eukprot:997094-Ditylum_brightwellii.AAC.1
MGGFETSVNGLVAAKNFSSTQDINQADLASAFTLRIGKSKKEMGQVVILRADLIGVATPKKEEESKRSVPAAAPAPAPAPADKVPVATAVPVAPAAFVPQAPAPAAPAAFVPPAPATDGPPPFVPPPASSGPAPFVPSTESGPAPFVPSAGSGPAPFVPSAGSGPAPFVPAAEETEPFVPPPPPPTFIDYVSGGCDLNLCVAVDFSSSNGDPRKSGTLHYFHRNGVEKNDYEMAISEIGGVLA